MIYQKIFTDEQPYRIALAKFVRFPEHRHADIEFNFCCEGEFTIMIDKKLYTVKPGEMAFIHPMISHSIPEGQSENKVVTGIVGVTLLKKYFSEFSKSNFKFSKYDLKEQGREELYSAFLECEDILHGCGRENELLVTSTVYKICSHMLSTLAVRDGEIADTRDYRRVENVERALELIYYNYKEPLTVERVAELTGYSKSNFCKIFKKIVGEGFHAALNRQRVNNAAGLLKVTNMPIADISAEVGFSEPKAFCRVFKSIYGITPGQYRRSKEV